MKLKRLYTRPDFWVSLMITGWGIVHLMGKFDISPEELAQTYWPVIFIVLGLVQLGVSRYRDPAAIALLMGIGLFLLMQNLNLFSWKQLQEITPTSLKQIIDLFRESVTWIFRWSQQLPGVRL